MNCLIPKKNYLEREDILTLNMEAALVFSGLLFMLLNAVTFQYKGDHYLSLKWMWLAPLALAIIYFVPSWLKIKSDVSFLLKSYCFYFLSFCAFLFLLNGVQYTPFPTIDAYLGTADQVLHIKETRLMDWTYAHPVLLKVLQFSYHSVMLQWLLMPLIMFLLKEKKRFYFYLIASLVAYLLGAFIYYFFPSIGPASIFSDPHFNRIQLDTVLNYKEIHQYLMVTTFDGGMIAFPSFHVLWSVITVYTLATTRKLIFIPALIFNLIATVATLFLGWNYAVDILCGMGVAFLAIYLANRLISKLNQPYFDKDSAILRY